MAEAPDKSVYLITGGDRPKIDTALTRLRTHFSPEAIESVSAVDRSGDEAVGLCNAGSLFGDGRLIVVRDVDGQRDGEGRRKGGWKAADVAAVTDYLANPAPATVLALVAEELKSSSALWKACAKAGSVLPFEVAKKELHGWVAEQFRQLGVRAEPEAVSALILLAGDDLTTLKVEVDKLATWASGEPIGEREVGRALEISESIFELESRPRRDVAPRLAGTLGSHVSRLRALQRLAAEGVRSKEAAERLKLHPFRAQKLMAQAEGFSGEELDDAVVRLAELDGALKGQSRIAPDLEVQRALVDLTRRPSSA